MTRQFKTIADAVPHTSEAMLLDVTRHGGQYFTAAETAQLMRMYGGMQSDLVENVHTSSLDEKEESEMRANCDLIEAKMAEWEKGLTPCKTQ